MERMIAMLDPTRGIGAKLEADIGKIVERNREYSFDWGDHAVRATRSDRTWWSAIAINEQPPFPFTEDEGVRYLLEANWPVIEGRVLDQGIYQSKDTVARITWTTGTHGIMCEIEVVGPIKAGVITYYESLRSNHKGYSPSGPWKTNFTQAQY